MALTKDPTAFILRHSFVRRLNNDLRMGFDPRASLDFKPRYPASVRLYGGAFWTKVQLDDDLCSVGSYLSSVRSYPCRYRVEWLCSVLLRFGRSLEQNLLPRLQEAQQLLAK